MGDLFRAVDESLGRPVAVKVLAERLVADDDVRRRFRREALAAARLSGEPNTVTIFDVGEWSGRPFIVMEYLGGGTVAQALRSGPQPPERALGWLEQAARSLDAAHAHGVIHRDVKPANLLLDDRGRVRVGDFGIATAAGLDSMTLAGTVLGTVGYLAPEQAQGRPATAVSDGYALAAVAYELLTGARPFARESPAAETAAHISAPVPSAARVNPALPAAVDRVFEKGLAKEPADRYPDCRAFVAALRSALSEPRLAATAPIEVRGEEAPTTIVRRRRRPVVGVVAGLTFVAGAGVAAALFAATRNTPRTDAAAGSTRTVTTVATVTSPAKTVDVTTPTTTAAVTPTPADANALNTRGYELMLAGNYAAALPLLRQAVAGLVDPANPVTAYANFNLGQTLVRLGQCPTAIPYLQRAAELEPARPIVHQALGYAQQCAGSQVGQAPATGQPDGRGYSDGQGQGGQDGGQNQNAS